MKKITIFFGLVMGFATAVATTIPVQYFKQRSLINTSALSEVQNLQVFLSGAYSLVGFEGAPRTFVLDAASPISFDNRRNRNMRGFRQAEPTRSFLCGTFEYESFGVHRHFRMVLGYAYRLMVGDNASVTFGVGGGISTISSNFDQIINGTETPIHSVRETSFAYRIGVRFDVDRLSVSAFNNDRDLMAEIVWGRLWDNDRTTRNNRNNQSGGFGFGDERTRNWRGQVAVLFIHSTDINHASIRFSANATNGGFGIGIRYQTGNDLSANVSLRITQALRIGYAYQLMALNPMARKHEIVIRYRLIRSDDDRGF